MECTVTSYEYQKWLLLFAQEADGVVVLAGRREDTSDMVPFADLPESVRWFCNPDDPTCKYVPGFDRIEKLMALAGQLYEVLADNVIRADVYCKVVTERTFEPAPLKFNNAADLLMGLTGQTPEDVQGDVEGRIKQVVYKTTDCGAWIGFSPCGIEVGSIVEGSDASVGPYKLYYPFSIEEYRAVLRIVEAEADQLWHEANDDDDPDQDIWWDETDLGYGG
jgi:hypothetical protein